MRLKSMKAGGIGVFSEVEFPIDQLDGARVVTLTGDNGEGKTQMLEMSFLGAPYRWTPGRGPLHVLANDKNSYVESKIEIDQVYTCRVTIDGASKTPKSSAYLIAEDGTPLNDGKVSTYDKAVAERFPSRDTVLASTFAAQNGEGRFLSLDGADRKALFLRMLGQGRLQELSTAAGARATAAMSEGVRIQGGIEAVQGSTEPIEVLLEKRMFAKDWLDDAKKVLGSLEAERTAATGALEKWNRDNAKLIELREKTIAELGAATATKDSSDEALSDLQDRAEIVDAELATTRERASEGPLLKRRLEGIGKPEDADSLKRDLEQARCSVKEADGLRERWRKTSTEVGRQEAFWESSKREAANKSRAARELWEQTAGRAESLKTVPCGGVGDYAGCPLIADAVGARDSRADLWTKTMEAEKEAASLLIVPDVLSDLRTEASDLVRRGKELGADPEAVTALEERIGTTQNLAAERTRIEADIESLRAYGQIAADLETKRSALKTEIAGAILEIDAATKAVESVTLRWEATTRRVVDHEEGRPPPTDGEALEAASKRVLDLATALENINTQVKAAQADQERVAELKAKLALLTAELDDWTHLKKALGRDGVQALEIDAAGPEVSSTANELLHAGYGPRFSVSLETTKAKASGKGSKEVFNLRVIDTERGTDGPAEHLSGGEQVLVEEGLGLAVAVYNMRRSPTSTASDLIRDEMSGALSAPRAVRYVAMLRRALDLGGFGRVYFVSHQPELWDLADQRVWIHDGKATLAETHEIIEGMRL